VRPPLLLAVPVQVRPCCAPCASRANSERSCADPGPTRRWMQVQSHCRVCPVCKAGIEQDKARPQSDGLPSTCCPWPRPEGVKALAAYVPSRPAGGAYLRPRGREHGPAAEGPVQEEGCGGRGRPQATSWAASRARAGAGQLASGGACSCVSQGVHTGCHPASALTRPPRGGPRSGRSSCSRATATCSPVWGSSPRCSACSMRQVQPAHTAAAWHPSHPHRLLTLRRATTVQARAAFRSP